MCRTSAWTSAIERLRIFHRQNALDSVKGTQSLIYIKQLLPLLRQDRRSDEENFGIFSCSCCFSEINPSLDFAPICFKPRVLRDSLPKYDRLTQLTGVNNHRGGGETRVAFQALLWTLDIFVRNFNKTVANYVRSILSVRTFIRPATEHRIFSFSGHVRVHPNMRPYSVNKVLWRSLNITFGSSQCLLWKNRCKKKYIAGGYCLKWGWQACATLSLVF